MFLLVLQVVLYFLVGSDGSSWTSYLGSDGYDSSVGSDGSRFYNNISQKGGNSKASKSSINS